MPPMSSASIATVAPFLCCALTQAQEVISTLAATNETSLGFTRAFMCSSNQPVQGDANARVVVAALPRRNLRPAHRECQLWRRWRSPRNAKSLVETLGENRRVLD